MLKLPEKTWVVYPFHTVPNMTVCTAKSQFLLSNRSRASKLQYIADGKDANSDYTSDDSKHSTENTVTRVLIEEVVQNNVIDVFI